MSISFVLDTYHHSYEPFTTISMLRKLLKWYCIDTDIIMVMFMSENKDTHNKKQITVISNFRRMIVSYLPDLESMVWHGYNLLMEVRLLPVTYVCCQIQRERSSEIQRLVRIVYTTYSSYRYHWERTLVYILYWSFFGYNVKFS